MINKKIYIILLSFAFIFMSCEEASNLESHSVNMKLVSFSGAQDGFNEMKSFRVEVFQNDKEVDRSDCKNFANTKDVKFNIDNGKTLFRFWGFKGSDCGNELDSDWKGKAETEIKSGQVNNIKIPVGRKNEFMNSSIEMHNPGAFMDAIIMDNKIILSGGISSISRKLDRVNTNEECDNNNANCVCYVFEENDKCSGYMRIDIGDENYTSCQNQGMDSANCAKCLELDSEHKFVKSTSECLINSCPLNLDGNDCALKGSSLVQYVDLENLYSNLLNNEGKPLSLSELRIFHKSYLDNGNLYFIGGAPEGFLGKKSPFISVVRYSEDNHRNMIDLYDSASLKSVGITGANINVDFNIIPSSNGFSIFGGKVNRDIIPKVFYDSIVNCTNGTCTELVDKKLSSIGSSVTQNEPFHILGGVSLTDDGFLDDLGLNSINNGAFESILKTEPKLYKPKLFNNNGDVYAVGGLKFTLSNNKVEFEDNAYNNKIIHYEIDKGTSTEINLPDALQNIIFSSILEYKYGDDLGLLFVGGLKKDGVTLKAVDTVKFISYANLSNNEANFVIEETLKTPRFAHSTVVDGDKVWVIGGLIDGATSNNFVVTNSIEIFIQ